MNAFRNDLTSGKVDPGLMTPHRAPVPASRDNS